VPITCIERVVVAVTDLDAACERWSKAGFAIAWKRFGGGGLEVARLCAGAIEIDLVAVAKDLAKTPEPLVSSLERGGGIIGWTWGVADAAIGDGANSLMLPSSSDGIALSISLANFLPGVWTGSAATDADLATRRARLEHLCGSNENTVDYLEHIVVMTPSLEDAIAAYEKIGLPCKRIREAGGGMRQAFFRLEQTVLEIVGPGRGTPQVWGLAFMCKDIRRAVHIARANGMEATAPKTAIQGGKIARIVGPLDGVAVAYMEP
jgi:predicted enzyme related to lactoylglutathione lyase